MLKPPKKKGWFPELLAERGIVATADATRRQMRLPEVPTYPTIGPAHSQGKPVDLSIKPDAYGDMRDIATEANGLLDILPGVGSIRGLAQGKQLADEGHPILGAALGAISALPEGGALARGIEKKLMKELAAEGGATLTKAGARFAGSGFAVADPAFTVTVHNADEMKSFLRRPDVLQALHEGKHIGKWTSPDGVTEINLTDIIPDRKQAMKVASQRGEQALGHLQDGEYLGDIANPHAPVMDAKALVEQMNGGKMMPRVTEIPAEKGKLLADTFESLPKNDPAAKGAYDALNAEVEKQYKAIEDAGFKIEYTDADPYKSSSEMMQDVRDNRRLKVFKTNDSAEHPYMTREQNDRFRAVHDFIAHAGGGNQFGAVGEENAFRIHASTLSPEAQRALATETRGQNSWVNFGPGSHLPQGQRPFAEQKAALFPEHLLGDYDAMTPKAGPGDLGPDGKYIMQQDAAAGQRSDPIVAAAVRSPASGKLYQGVVHADAIDQIREAEGKHVADAVQKSDSWHDLFVTKSGETIKRRALADEWGGRRPIAEMMKLPGETPAPAGGLLAEPQLEAPQLNLGGEGGNTIPLDVSINPEGVDASRPELYRPARADLSVLDPVIRRVKSVYTPAAERGLKEGGIGPAWYDLSPLKRIFEQESPTGAEDFKMFTRLMGPTSAGTDVPMNIRQASLFYKLWKDGKLTADALRTKGLTIPPGYGNRLNIRGPLERVATTGHLDPLATPKTYRYSEQLGGGSWGGTALDRHVGYNIGLKGEHVGSDINTAGAGKRGFPTGGYAETRQVSTSPQNTHYAAIEDAMVREANKLGVHPAVYQASGWVGNALRTGVEDARHPIEIINAKLGETAAKYGHKSRTAALRAFIRGETPLWALGGLTAGGLLSEDEPRGGGLLAEQ